MILNQYGFWLLILSIGCFCAERFFPWRKKQKWSRPGFAQDLFWLGFNGYALSYFLGPLLNVLHQGFDRLFFLFGGRAIDTYHLFRSFSFALQVVLLLLIIDLIEYLVHNLLHRYDPLWKFHRLHHSIRQMDWIGNFRFHWMEVVVYQSVKLLPFTLMGVDPLAGLIAAVISTLIGHLNHANLDISWGPLRYLLNSPRMHIWHHDKNPPRQAGVNFGIVFSVWDWILGTAHWPKENKMPQTLGFQADDRFSPVLIRRFFLPFLDSKG